MTLVLGLITDDFIIHVSDRRLTDGRTGRQVTTKAAKTVICPQAMYMVSFTGLAQIAPPMATGEWLMRTLWQNKDADLFESLAWAAGQAIRALSIPMALKRHAFLVSGWLHHGSWETSAPLPPGFKPGAFSSVVSNFLDLSGVGRVYPEPQAVFTHGTCPLMPSEKFLIGSVGARLRDDERDALNRDVSAALRSREGRERAAALLMVRTVRSVAERDPTVGGGAFIAAIPRHHRAGSSGDRQGLNVLGVRWGLPEQEAATFVHIPDEETNTVETPYILADPFSGIGTITITKGSVPGLRPFLGIPEAGEFTLTLLPLRGSDELRPR